MEGTETLCRDDIGDLLGSPEHLCLNRKGQWNCATCLPNSSGQNCCKAKCTAHSSRQLMCQSSRGPVQSPKAACPLHVAPQPVLEASVGTTVCRDTCSRGAAARRKGRSVQGLRERWHCWVIPTRSIPWRHAHFGTRECSQCWSGLIWNNPSSMTAAADAICPRSLWNLFQWYHIPASEGTRAVQHCLGTFLREACRHTHTQLHTEKRDFLHRGELVLFPVDPKPQLAEVPEHQVPGIAKLLSGFG